MTESEYKEKIKELTEENRLLFRLSQQARKEAIYDVLSACRRYCTVYKKGIGEEQLQEISKMYGIQIF